MKKRFFSVTQKIKLILKATRLNRGSYAALSIFTAASFVNVLNKDIIILVVLGFLLYSVAGLHNAMVDNDYKIKKKHFYLALLIIIFLSLILGLTNFKILILIFLI